MQITKETIFGVGVAYPCQLDATNSRPLVASGVSIIEMSIEQIINTDSNERPFLVKSGIPYGTRLARALFESTSLVIDVFRYDVPKTLSTWEPRIYVIDANAILHPNIDNMIVGTVRYMVRATNREDNFVRPYRLQRVTP